MVRFILLLTMLWSCLLMAQEAKKTLTLEGLLYEHTFTEKKISDFTPLSNGGFSTLRDGKYIIRYSNHKNQLIADTLFNLDRLPIGSFKEIDDYSISTDGSKLLLATESEKLYRHSFFANYYVYNTSNKQLQPVAPGKGKIRLAELSPDGKNAALVRDNNLFIYHLETKTETAITVDGKANEIINGAPDWVYEEEFVLIKAFEWSPNGSQIAFWRFDETQVPVYDMQVFKQNLYPQVYQFKYPKAGENNSTTDVYVYHINEQKTVKMNTGIEPDRYLPRIRWSDDSNTLAILRLPRLQNQLEVLFAQAETGQSKVIYTEKSDTYITEPTDETFSFIDDKNQFILMSERDGFNHLYLFEANGKLKQQITQGNWDVTAFYGYDARSKRVFYQAAPDKPYQTGVYAQSINGKNRQTLHQKSGTNNALFSNNYDYFINTWSSVHHPSKYELFDSNGRKLAVFEDNVELTEILAEYEIPQKEFFSFTTPDSVTLNGWMLKPTTFDASKKYPVLMFVYGGPGSQTVTDNWKLEWFQYLAQQGYLVVSVDNRGTGNRGSAFKKATYKKLGVIEVNDQIAAARFLQSQPFIDAQRIGIFGWSYGGYMSTLCMLRGNNVFKCGVAVAPVTDWRFYDTVYTERYMSTPTENPDGYSNSSVLDEAGALKGSYLLIHGTADDNVHIQNSYEWASQLVNANKSFEMQVYTDKDHAIRGGYTRLHIYNRIIGFIQSRL